MKKLSTHANKGVNLVIAHDKNTTELTLWAESMLTNGKNENKTIKGYEIISETAEGLKAKGHKTASLKTTIATVCKVLDINLSLQGLGSKQTAIMKVPMPKQGGAKVGKLVTKKETAQAKANKVLKLETKRVYFDEGHDKAFMSMPTDQQKLHIAHLTKLMTTVTKKRANNN